MPIKIPRIECEYCGASLKKTDTYCTYCGSELVPDAAYEVKKESYDIVAMDLVTKYKVEPTTNKLIFRPEQKDIVYDRLGNVLKHVIPIGFNGPFDMSKREYFRNMKRKFVADVYFIMNNEVTRAQILLLNAEDIKPLLSGLFHVVLTDVGDYITRKGETSHTFARHKYIVKEMVDIKILKKIEKPFSEKLYSEERLKNIHEMYSLYTIEGICNHIRQTDKFDVINIVTDNFPGENSFNAFFRKSMLGDIKFGDEIFVTGLPWNIKKRIYSLNGTGVFLVQSYKIDLILDS